MLGLVSSAFNEWRAGQPDFGRSAVESAKRSAVTSSVNRVGSLMRGFDLLSKNTGLPNPMYRVPRPDPAPPSGGAPDSTGAPSAKSLDYLNADLAKYYGMSKETAYSEALSNTAYQRAVKDMQAAGLNPAVLFGAGRASTADGVSVIRSASSGSGGGSSRRSSGGASAKHVFDNGAYGAISTAAGLVAAVATKNPGNFWIGSTAAKGVMGAINSLAK